MATTCPNTNLKEWKSLVESKGEDMAYFLWDQYDGKVPLDIINAVSDLSSTSESLVNATFNTNSLNSDVRTYSNYIADGEDAFKEILDSISRLYIYENAFSDNRKKGLLDNKYDIKGLKEIQADLQKQIDSGSTINQIYQKKVNDLKQDLKYYQKLSIIINDKNK